MRPKHLFPIFTHVTRLPGIGPKIGNTLERFTGSQIIDLLWHLPSGVIDRRYSPKIADAAEGSIATIVITVNKHAPSPGRGIPYRIRCSDETGVLDLVFFNARKEYLKNLLPEGETRVVSGKIERYRKSVQIAHPDHIGKLDEIETIKTVEAVYPLTAGLTNKPLSKAVKAAIKLAPNLDEWQDPAWLKQQNWKSWRETLYKAHSPQSESDLQIEAIPRQRLAYDELLANQLALEIVRRRQKKRIGRSISGDGSLRERLIKILPFVLTETQQKAVSEISNDMKLSTRMLRLLQGDVGSGKTIVALMTMLIAAEQGSQAALMAPTEILARQHFATIRPIAQKIGIEIVLITGRDKGKKRGEILNNLSRGKVAIVIGTHALFQQDVAFRDLAFIVVDEQHRFGVHQRLSLAEKGAAADMLVMTATPIPRTLMMTAYGDMDSTRLTEKPAGRPIIETRVMPLERLGEIINRLHHAIKDGCRAYWVCPLIDESEALDITAVTERYSVLQRHFGNKVGLVHGRMKSEQKDSVMEEFSSGKIDVLVATTVIEVGVDVPEATIIVVEQAERFGLAQLHQLRGRVGRGKKVSSCILMYGGSPGQTATKRLKVMRETNDGFLIADEDLRLRGAGEVLGTRQSGLPDFKFVDLNKHANLLATAKDDVKLLLERDPDLKTSRGQALRTLLYLFERDTVVKTALSG